MNTEAGQGVANTFHLELSNDDTKNSFEPRKHYVRIDAISWFVNKQSNFWKDYISSGTLRIKIADEIFDLGLGTYVLEKGMRTAPIFNRPIIEDKVYNGGDLTISTSLSAIKKDTLLGKILKDLGKSTIEVANGAIKAATVMGPQKALLDVSTSLTDNITAILNQGDKKIEFATIEDTYQLQKLDGIENFILLHRGAKIDKKDLTLDFDGEHKVNLMYKGKPFEDGVWILLRISKVDKYSGVRPWFQKARETRTEIQNLLDSFEFGSMTREAALKQLTPSEQDPNNIASKTMDLISIIRNDFVLSFRDAMLESVEFKTLLKNAREAIKANDVQKFVTKNKNFYDVISQTISPNNEIKALFNEEFQSLTFRNMTLKSNTKALENEDLWSSIGQTSILSAKNEGAGI